nr:isochorismatase family cysteine hydrolase [uncultured Merdimonas sp.]
MKILVVVDMQNDFIDGALGTREAVTIVPKVVEKIKSFEGRILFTRDTHEADYLGTQEGKNLPVEHCIRGTKGWELAPEIEKLRTEEPIDKPSFGSISLGTLLKAQDEDLKKQGEPGIESITLIGLCTDICVISNAMILKAYLPEVPVIVDADCCAGVTPESHKNALEAMKVCQIKIED